MKNFKPILVLGEAALLILATCLVFIPELRVWPIKICFNVLFFLTGGHYLFRLRKAGLLGKTPRQMRGHGPLPMPSLVAYCAWAMGCVAVTMML